MRLYKRESTGYWYVDLLVGNRRIRQSLKTKSKRLATERLKDVLDDYPAGGESSGGRISLKQFFREYIRHCERTHTHKTLESNVPRMNVLVRFFEVHKFRLVGDIDRNVVNQLKEYLWDRGVKNATVNRYISVLKAAMTFAVESGYLRSSPLREVRKLPEKRGNARRLIEKDDIEIIIKNSPSRLYGDFVEMLSLTGVRLDDMRQLRCSNVNLTREEVTFEETKTHEALTVPLNARAVEILSQRVDPGKAFVFGGSQPAWNRNVASQTFRRIAKRFGIMGSVHDLRATFVSQLLRKGVDLKTVQGLIGDKTTHMVLEIYALIVPGSAREAISKL